MSYIVTEFVPGGSLSQFTGPSGLLPVSEVVEIGFKCSGALDYAFRNNVIHRDIKPANIRRRALRDAGWKAPVYRREQRPGPA